jgi:hypothetical protein
MRENSFLSLDIKLYPGLSGQMSQYESFFGESVELGLYFLKQRILTNRRTIRERLFAKEQTSTQINSRK